MGKPVIESHRGDSVFRRDRTGKVLAYRGGAAGDAAAANSSNARATGRGREPPWGATCDNVEMPLYRSFVQAVNDCTKYGGECASKLLQCVRRWQKGNSFTMFTPSDEGFSAPTEDIRRSRLVVFDASSINNGSLDANLNQQLQIRQRRFNQCNTEESGNSKIRGHCVIFMGLPGCKSKVAFLTVCGDVNK